MQNNLPVITFASRSGSLKGQSVDGDGALNSFQVQVGGHLSGVTTVVRVVDIFPGLFAVQDSLFNVLDFERSFQSLKNGFLLNGLRGLNFVGENQTTSQDVAFGQILSILFGDKGEIIGKRVDDKNLVQDAASIVFVE